MKQTNNFNWICGLALILSGVFMVGCDSDGSVVREVDISVSGFYYGQDGARMVRNNSGEPIASMNILQRGDSLEGYDNNGHVFRGTISRVYNDSPRIAQFSMEGTTTTGAAGSLVGNFSVTGTESSMRGTWLEDAVASDVYALADVAVSPEISTNSVTASVAE